MHPRKPRFGARPVLLYLYLHNRSGAPQYHPYEYRLIETLSRKCTVVAAFFTRSKKVEFQERIAPPQVLLLPIRDLPLVDRLPSLLRWPLDTTLRTLRTLLLAWIMRPDVLDGNWLTRDGGVFCSFSGYHPFLATAWGSDILVEATKSRILRLFGKLTVRIADSVIVDSEVQRKAVIRLGCDSSKIYSFPWGIDLDIFRLRKKTSPTKDLKQWGRKTKIIISTRNHFPIYGIEYLIRAIPLILEKVDYARFLIVGDGPLLTYYKALVKQMGIEDYVRFPGRVPQAALARLLNFADIYVSTSLSDGTSASLLEALATGLPTVVTAIPANREWIVHGRNGFLVPPSDSTALADSIVRLLESETLRSKMRHFNLRVAEERADWKINSRVLERCISNLLKRS